MMKRNFYAAFIACLVAGLCEAGVHNSASAAPPDRLQPPFHIAKPHTGTDGTEARPVTCDDPPSPIRDLTFQGFYRKGTGSSIIDHDAMRRYRAARKPVDDFEKAMIKLSDRYIATRQASPAIAACVLDGLSRWAIAGAYLGEVSPQGGFVRKWSLGTISLAYLKIRDADGLDAPKKKSVKRWIDKWAAIVHDDYSTDLHKSSRNNNHAYWAAWSVGLAAVVLDRRDLFDWTMGRYQTAIRDIRPDGTLPLELKRGPKALHYHVFSVQALVLIAELGARNNVDLYGGENGALKRLVTRTMEGLSDPGFFVSKTGKKQNWVGKLSGSKLAWMEPYYARHQDLALKPWIEKFRPLKNRRIGGNATLLYGRKLLDQ